jgi:hypothetical protein
LRSWSDQHSLQRFFTAQFQSVFLKIQSASLIDSRSGLKSSYPVKSMDITITAAILVVLTVAMLFLRIFWLRVPLRLRAFLLRGAVAMVLLHLIFVTTKWGTTSTHVNAAINWLAIAGYELLILLYTRLSPRWLTSLCAAILLIPLFAASILSPLALVLQPDSVPFVPLGNHLFYKTVPWGNNGAGNPGVDINIYYIPPFATFLTRKLGSQAFSTQYCDAFTAYALPGPEPKTVIARCPFSPAQQSGSEDRILRVH